MIRWIILSSISVLYSLLPSLCYRLIHLNRLKEVWNRVHHDIFHKVLLLLIDNSISLNSVALCIKGLKKKYFSKTSTDLKQTKQFKANHKSSYSYHFALWFLCGNSNSNHYHYSLLLNKPRLKSPGCNARYWPPFVSKSKLKQFVFEKRNLLIIILRLEGFRIGVLCSILWSSRGAKICATCKLCYGLLCFLTF